MGIWSGGSGGGDLTPRRSRSRLSDLLPLGGDASISVRYATFGEESMPFKDGDHLDPVGKDAIDDSVSLSDHLAHILALEFGDNSAGLRKVSRLPCPFL